MGDTASMDEVVRRHWRALVDYGSRFADDRDTAKDLAQDTLLALWEGKVIWKETGTLRSFLFGVARNLARNQGRKWREVRTLKLVDAADTGETTPLDRLEENDLRRMISAAVAELPARRQEVFLLARVHGLTHAEISQTMKISIQTVANQMNAALADLRARLARLI